MRRIINYIWKQLSRISLYNYILICVILYVWISYLINIRKTEIREYFHSQRQGVSRVILDISRETFMNELNLIDFKKLGPGLELDEVSKARVNDYNKKQNALIVEQENILKEIGDKEKYHLKYWWLSYQ